MRSRDAAAREAGKPASDARRIMASIDEFARMTSTAQGVTRLAYTPMERVAHEHFAKHMENLGLRVWTDPAGNTIAEKPGDPGRPEAYGGRGAVGTGSHLDSVPGAGRFDGIAGVAAAMECARLVVEHGIAHHHPFRFVAFAAEEGARFGQACLGSRFATGKMSSAQVTSLQDADRVTLGEAMKQVGLDPDLALGTPWPAAEWSAFVELHVEQGGILDAAGVPVGVVDLVSGSTRLRLTVTGQSSHTGATPMGQRADALTGACEIALIAEELAQDPRHRGTRATVGTLDVRPGSLTTIPGQVRLGLDVRDIDSDRQRAATAEIVRRARSVCDRRGLALAVEVLGDTSPAVLPLWLRSVIADACRTEQVPYQVLTSGASHDSQVVNSLMPAAIVFVPSSNGLSHVPQEWTSAGDLARGTDVLLATLRMVDQELVRLAQLDRADEPAEQEPSMPGARR
ncbi:Zn-dependent hydrolase [Streptomyces sp. Agncl-13]|uniref:Zn-dependent hydrolase n=1 Tax=Streptomyces sp. Agncl-13 TaxID=3400628 RepID=UPI003A86562A